MKLVIAFVAAVTSSTVDVALPEGVTPIAELDSVDGFHHAEVLQVERDFGQPNVNVALDAWMPADAPGQIDGVRLWWSDEVDRYPFSDDVLRQVEIDYRRLRPDRWRISLVGGRQRFAFDIAIRDGRPAVVADVVVGGGRVVRQCRAASARLRARRILGIPIGLQSLAVTCTTSDGEVHEGHVRTSTDGRRRARRR